MSKDQKKDNKRDPNDHFRKGEEARIKETAQREEETVYPRLPSYSEVVPRTHPSYLQHNHTATGSTSYIPPWYNHGDVVQDTGVPQGSRFGLIRGYHQQMYEQNQTSMQCCDCTSFQRSKQGSRDDKCNWGVILGLLLIILGVFALVMGFTLPQKTYNESERQRLTPQEKKEIENMNFYIEIFILSGLSVLSMGGIIVSMGILYPVCRRGKDDEYENSIFGKYYGSDVYVKEEQVALPGKEGHRKTLVNFDFYKDVVPTDVTLRKIQPEREHTEPIDAENKLFK